MALTLMSFFLALLLLITVHEFGHFIVARWCGVMVLRFSFGFGKVLFRWHDKKGTEYAWSLFPLGGYVKMLDENEGEVPRHERHRALNNQSVWARMAIVIAGPLFNFLFAFFALWLVLILGVQSLAPIIDKVNTNSLAASVGFEAKQEIISVNNNPVSSWRDVQLAFMPLLGFQENRSIRVKSLLNGQVKELVLPLKGGVFDANSPDALSDLGITPFIPRIPPIVGEVMNDSVAKKAGLQVGDELTRMNGKPLKDWFELLHYVKQHPQKPLELTLLRQGDRHTINLLIGVKSGQLGGKEGVLGVRSQAVTWPSQWLRMQRQDPITAFKTAFRQTVDLSSASFAFIWRFARGFVGLQSISGPVGIAQGAGESARMGLSYYLSFLALVSISLGVLNILPIPLLDGGHLLYCVLEAIIRRPVPNKIKSIGLSLGVMVIIALTIVALSNDLSRLRG